MVPSMCTSFESLILYTFAAILSMTSCIAAADGVVEEEEWELLSKEEELLEEAEEWELVSKEEELLEREAKSTIKCPVTEVNHLTCSIKLMVNVRSRVSSNPNFSACSS